MGVLSDRSLLQIKTGENAPRSLVTLGGLELTGEGGGGASSLLNSLSATYAVSAGTSEANLASSLPLDDFINAPLRLRLGYGDRLEPYFDGHLNYVEDDDWTSSYSATAYGPYRNMAEQELGEQVDYRGSSLLDVFMDLYKRAGVSTSRLDIQGGRNFVLQGEDAVFPFETKLSDVAAQIAGAGGYVVLDMPDFRQVVKPTPRIGATAKAKARYDESSIPYGGFRATSSVRRVYGRVALFRRGEGGSFEVGPVIVPVAQSGKYKALPGKTYTVSDYMGDAKDALKDAQVIAKLLEGGMYECELSGIAANPEILPHDTLSVEVREMRYRGGRTKDPVLVRYLYNADNTITATVDASGNRMSVSGTGVVVFEKSLPKPHYVTRTLPGSGRRSDYAVVMPDLGRLVPTPELTPSPTLTPGRRQH